MAKRTTNTLVRPIHEPPEPEEQEDPEYKKLRQLAAAVVAVAISDLTDHDPNVRADAHEFLTITLWMHDCVWRAILPELKSHRVLATVKARGSLPPRVRRKNNHNMPKVREVGNANAGRG